VLGGRYPDLVPELERLRILRWQMVRKIMEGPGTGGLEADQQLLARWMQERDQLEAELALRIPEMRLEQHLASLGRQAIAQSLPEKTALVEYVRFRVRNFQAVPAAGQKKWGDSRYVAFVLENQ